MDKIFVMEVVLYIVMAGHIFICPYTKVEESFNLQAIHDLLYHGPNISMYDHLEFPGVVPRTFLGPIVIAAISYPFLYLTAYFNLSKFFMQYKLYGINIHPENIGSLMQSVELHGDMQFHNHTIMSLHQYSSIEMRLVLGTLLMFAFHKFQKAVNLQFGPTVAAWLLIITASQFHLMFYISRPLPNIFALFLALFAFHYWLTENQRMFLFTSAAAAIIFRAELSILLGFIALGQFISGKLNLLAIVCWGLPDAIWMLGLTVFVDSFFWMRPVWPEGEVLWFNIFLNKSSEWGTSPWAWYFYSALPRALLASVFFIPFSFMLDYRVRALLYPALGFITVYSFLPHKELRFIIYAIPLLNVAAARTCSHIWNNRHKSTFFNILHNITCLHIVLNLSATIFILSISYYNYPGGYAMAKLHELEGSESGVSVHIDVYCAQTGISRFTELNSHWWYDKTENLPPKGEDIMKFSHLLMEWPENTALSQLPYYNTHTVLNVTSGYSHWQIDFDFDSFPPLQVYHRPRVLILKRTIPFPSLILNSTNIKSLKF